MKKLFKPLTSKGAAFVEYVVLLGLIGVTLIAVIVGFGTQVDRTFETTTTVIASRLITDVPGDTDPDPTDPTDPPVTPDEPDIPLFPPPDEPDSGLEHAFTYDVYMSYWDPTSITFDQIAAEIEDEAVAARDLGNQPTWYFSGNPPPNWQFDVNWTALERSEPFPDPLQAFPYNEFAFTASGFTHNVGPLAGWGDQPESLVECLASIPNSEQYQLRGHLSNGDQILIYLNLPPEECAVNHDVYRDIIVTHNGAGAGNYGQIANVELAGISNLDWTQATWTVQESDIDSVGMVFSGLFIGNNDYGYNLVPGPAWQDIDSGYSTCYEGGSYAYGRIFGVHPNNETVTFYITFQSQIGDTSIPGGDPTCYPGYR